MGMGSVEGESELFSKHKRAVFNICKRMHLLPSKIREQILICDFLGWPTQILSQKPPATVLGEKCSLKSRSH
jgi:hypothetical protein